jgi:hypothetical protein
MKIVASCSKSAAAQLPTYPFRFLTHCPMLISAISIFPNIQLPILLLQQILKNSKWRFRKSSRPKSFCLAKVWKSPFPFPAGNGFRCSSRRRGRRSLPTSTHPQNFFLAFGGLHHNPFRFSDPPPLVTKRRKLMPHRFAAAAACRLLLFPAKLKTEN